MSCVCGAQRLSASEGKTVVGKVEGGYRYEGAQRLSASEGKTVEQVVHCRDRAAVLNAFRHQRGKQFFASHAALCCVLCSTPFGIRGENRRAGAGDSRGTYSAQRLSASEGKTANACSVCFSRGYLCSTPFGIRGENRRCASRRWLPQKKCSTPFGIRGENSVQ